MSPKWEGPLKGGITQSIITKFLECPYRAYLYFVEGLVEAGPLHPNLIWGDIFHVGLEHLIPTGDYDHAEEKMIEYLYDTHPSAPETYRYSTAEMLKLYSLKDIKGEYRTEVPLDQIIDIPESRDFPAFQVRARGKMDGTPDDPSLPLLEHKCKSKLEILQVIHETPFDMQTNLYCHLHGLTSVRYDVIRIPEAQFKQPYRKSGERSETYIKRIFHDYQGQDYPIAKTKMNWMQSPVIPIPEERQEQFLLYSFYPLCRLVQAWYDLVSSSDFDVENPSHYGPLFYRTPIRHFDPSNTEKFKCSYHSFLTEQIEKHELVPVTSFYSELPDAES